MNSIDFESIDLNAILERCGFQAVYVKGDSAWYRSPFREEKTPSFQVRGSVFTDWGDPDCKGGVLDLCSRLFDIPRDNIRDLIHNLNAMMGKEVIPPPTFHKEIRTKVVKRPEKIVGSYPLNNPAIYDYLASRGVELSVAQEFTSLIVYLNRDRTKRFFGVGFRNRSGGYELRSEFAKRSFAPKDISVLPPNGTSDGPGYAVVFEGFMDALSYLSEKVRNGQTISFTSVVLNGVGLVEHAIDELRKYQKVYGLLDNDVAGDSATEKLTTALPNFSDSRSWLGNFKDVNEKIMDIEEKRKKQGVAENHQKSATQKRSV